MEKWIEGIKWLLFGVALTYCVIFAINQYKKWFSPLKADRTLSNFIVYSQNFEQWNALFDPPESWQEVKGLVFGKAYRFWVQDDTKENVISITIESTRPGGMSFTAPVIDGYAEINFNKSDHSPIIAKLHWSKKGFYISPNTEIRTQLENIIDRDVLIPLKIVR